MNLEDYLRKQLTRQDPHPAIDHRIRAELHADGRVSFYIHADGRDSDTETFWVKDNEVEEKRLYREPLSEKLWAKILKATQRFHAYRSKDVYLVVDGEYDPKTIAEWIETVGGGVSAGPVGYEGPDHSQSFVFKPCLGAEEKARDLAYLDAKHDGMGYCYLKT